MPVAFFVEDGAALAARDDVEVVIEATGSPPAGIAHALAAIDAGKHIVMVNVEADVLAGPALAARARAAGTVYSLAYGDQPALVPFIDLLLDRIHLSIENGEVTFIDAPWNSAR